MGERQAGGKGGVSRLSSRKNKKKEFFEKLHEKVLTSIRVYDIMSTTKQRRMQQ